MATCMDPEDLAKRIRDACLETVLQEYEDAGAQGLCAEGRWEAAVGALRTPDSHRCCVSSRADQPM